MISTNQYVFSSFHHPEFSSFSRLFSAKANPGRGPLPMQNVGVWHHVAPPKSVKYLETWTHIWSKYLHNMPVNKNKHNFLCFFRAAIKNSRHKISACTANVTKCSAHLSACHPAPVENEPWWHLLLCHSRSPVQRLDRPLPSGIIG